MTPPSGAINSTLAPCQLLFILKTKRSFCLEDTTCAALALGPNTATDVVNKFRQIAIMIEIFICCWFSKKNEKPCQERDPWMEQIFKGSSDAFVPDWEEGSVKAVPWRDPRTVFQSQPLCPWIP